VFASIALSVLFSEQAAFPIDFVRNARHYFAHHRNASDLRRPSAPSGDHVAKNIVICCDGTGNEFGDNNSNVVKVYSALTIDGQHQVGYYHLGVGDGGTDGAQQDH
jgi:uncharacterized protein (DUF2235 family)